MALEEDFKAAADNRIDCLMDRLSKVPEGEAIAAFLKMYKVKFELQDDPYNWAASTLTITHIKDGLYFYQDPIIILKKGLSDDNLLQAIVHETAHLNQHYTHVGNPDRILTKEQYILFYRASEADAQALTTEIAWALKQAGDAGPWEAAKFVGYGDITDAYEKIATADPSSIKDGRAKRVAFDAWFSSEDRLAGYNKATVEGMIPFLERGREIFTNHSMTQKPLDDSWLVKMETGAGLPYLHQEGYRDVLGDTYYSRNTDTRPPAPKPANNNAPNNDAPRLSA